MCTIANGATTTANSVDDPMMPIASCWVSCTRMCAARPSVVAMRQRLIVRRNRGENGFSKMNFANRERFDCRSVCC